MDNGQQFELQLTSAQERFCRLCANPPPIGTETDWEAYAVAYPNVREEKLARQGAWRLFRMPKIRKRIAEIRQENARQSNVKPGQVLDELAKIAFAKITDYVRWDAEGNIEALSSDELTDDQKAAIQEVLGRDNWKGRRIRLYDKIAALDRLAKYLGLLTEKVDITSGGEPFATLTDEQRIERITALLDIARARLSGSDAKQKEWQVPLA